MTVVCRASQTTDCNKDLFDENDDMAVRNIAPINLYFSFIIPISVVYRDDSLGLVIQFTSLNLSSGSDNTHYC